MAPLILHNVPDDECYIGEDGIKRPYAMIFNQQDGPRSRRQVPESGSFGKSTRRSRSRTTTPSLRARENPTLAAADKLFGDWVSANQASTPIPDDDSPPVTQQQQPQQPRSQPVEMMLRGYRSSTQQYAAIAHFESLAGGILEDYPREPPSNQRRYQSQLRDPAFIRRRHLTPDERAMVSRADSGEHWVKITFESAEAAETAIYASPQRILGHLVYAEPYRGMPPAKDEAIPDDSYEGHGRSRGVNNATPRATGLPTSFSSRLIDLNNSPGTSSATLETGTLSSATATEAPAAAVDKPSSSAYCRKIPTARRAVLQPAEMALRPQQSVSQRLLGLIPFLSWFSGSIIGNEIPRTETGEFDWDKASLYWKFIWWLDATFSLFKGDVCNVDKDE